MNFKTTVTLAIVLAALGMAFVWTRASAPPATVASAPIGATPITADLVEEPLGELTKIVCKKDSGEEWVFERGESEGPGGASNWNMTAPQPFTAVGYEVEGIGRTLSRLQYDVSCTPGGADCVTLEAAGLEPPRAVIALTDTTGRSVGIEIGKPVSGSETYVRREGDDRVYYAKSSLDTLLKPKAIDYRDKLLWSFDMNDAVKLEFETRSETGEVTSTVLGKKDGRWMFEQPVSAKATNKVDDMLRSMQRMRTAQWLDDRADRLSSYGLSEAGLVIKATVEEKVESASEDGDQSGEESVPETPQTKETVYVLHVSDQSPIGEDTKAYIRVGDEQFVGTIMKTIADKLRPDLSKWRDMRVTDADVAAATSVELSVEGEEILLENKGGRWMLGGDAPAEGDEVTTLLTAIADLSAVTFLDNADMKTCGLDQPRATIRLTIPGEDEPQRIAVGGFTDTKTQRLVYVRRNEQTAAAKVRASDVAPLLRAGSTYRDRTVFDVPKLEVQSIQIDRKHPLSGEEERLTFVLDGDHWKLATPVEAKLQGNAFSDFIQTLSGLRAEAIVAPREQATAYGLTNPAVKVSFTRQPPPEYSVEVKEGEDGAEAQPVEIAKPPVTLSLAIADHDGHAFARRNESDPVFRIDRSVLETALSEWLPTDVCDASADDVVRFSVRSQGSADAFVRDEDGWVYEAEKDLPLDAKKVDDLLLRILDLQAERYVRYQVDDLERYGLSDESVTLSMKDGSSWKLLISSSDCCAAAPGSGKYAVVNGSDGVFLLSADSIGRLAVNLGDLEEGR